MTAIVIILISVLPPDSLPPLPDLSQATMPEPPFWTDVSLYQGIIKFLVGGYLGGTVNLSAPGTSFYCSYQEKNDWTTIRHAILNAGSKFQIGRWEWIPSFNSLAFFWKPDGVYRFGYELSSLFDSKPCLINFHLQQDIWFINSTAHLENQASLTASWDRSQILPQINMKVINQDSGWYPAGFAAVHINPFHFTVGSLLWPAETSPHLEISFRDMNNVLSVKYQYGVIPRQFAETIDYGLPIRYVFPAPQERSGWSVMVTAQRNLPHSGISACYQHYENWDRLGINAARQIMLFEKINTEIVSVMANFAIRGNRFQINNSLVWEYEKTKPSMPYIARDRGRDELKIAFRAIELLWRGQYLSSRAGHFIRLPALVLIDGRLGYQIKTVCLFIGFYNLRGQIVPVYDHYLLYPRRYAGGIEITLW